MYLPKLTSSILMEIVTIPLVLVGEFYFCMHHPIRPGFLKKKSLSQFIFAFSYNLKITCTLLRQITSIKKMVVLSVKFTIFNSCFSCLYSFNPFSALMKLASTSATILHKSMESRHPQRTNIRIKGSDRRPFVLTLDIGVCNFNHAN